jgi:uncharacterized damage-inducible protein DinB
MPTKEEYWLSGPVAGVPALLQPVAHALLQARDEILAAVQDIDESRLWERPNKLASVGFHLKHIVGVLDRLFTYVQGKALSAEQMAYLSEEGRQTDGETGVDLANRLSAQVEKSIEFLKSVDPSILTDARAVGRKQLPGTVLGLLFHSAEHTMRHCGQLLVTARVVGVS